MAVSWIKTLTGTVDGVNRTFFVPAGFLPVISGSEAVFVRTLLRRKDFDDGWTVVSYTTGEILLNEAPLLGDTVDAFFRQDIEVTVTTEGPIRGTILPTNAVYGQISGQPLVGCVSSQEALCGVVGGPSIIAELGSGPQITGIIED